MASPEHQNGLPPRRGTTGGYNPAYELAKEVNRRPIRSTFGVLYGGSVVVGATGGAALYATGGAAGSGVTTLGINTVNPGEFAAIGSRQAAANFIGMRSTNVLNVSNWSPAIQAQWIGRMISMRMPFFMAGGALINRATGAPTQYALEIQQALAAGYVQVGQWLFPR